MVVIIFERSISIFSVLDVTKVYHYQYQCKMMKVKSITSIRTFNQWWHEKMSVDVVVVVVVMVALGCGGVVRLGCGRCQCVRPSWSNSQ